MSDLYDELNEAVNELIREVEATAHKRFEDQWVADVHDTSDDTTVIGDAAAHIEQRLEH